MKKAKKNGNSMACACKVNQKIGYIQKKYGTNNLTFKKKTKIKITAKIFFESILVWIIILPLIPVMICYLLYKQFFSEENKINIFQLLRIKSYGKQQKLQNKN